MKNPRYIGPNRKHSSTQSRITFQLGISKSHFFSFLQSMYNLIKLSNQNNMNFKKRRKSSNILPRKITPQVTRSGYLLAAPSMLILTQPDEGNSRLTDHKRTYSKQNFDKNNFTLIIEIQK